jgi:tetratricopeptide (TPR) repeat protein
MVCLALKFYKLKNILLVMLSNKSFMIIIPACLYLFDANISPEYFIERGIIEQKAGMYKEAILSYNRAIDLDKRNYKTYNHLSSLYIMINRPEKALEAAMVSVEINSKQPDIWYRAGELNEYYLENDRAFECYNKAAENETSHILANLALARFYLIKGETDKAMRYFEVSKRSAEAKYGLIYTKAISAFNKKDINNAIALFEEMLAKAPSIIESYHMLYSCYRLKNDNINAAKTYERLKHIRPDIYISYLRLGELYLNRNFPGKKKIWIHKSEINLIKALELNPESPEACEALVSLYRFTGQIEKSIAVKNRCEKKQYCCE